MATGNSAVHPMGLNAPAPVGVQQQEEPVVELDDFLPEIAGKMRGMVLRGLQGAFAAVAGFLIALSGEVTTLAFSILFVACAVQLIWSSAVAALDTAMLSIKRSIRSMWVLGVLITVDTVIGGFTFFSACSSAGLIILLDLDLKVCDVNNCLFLKLGTAAAFLSALFIAPCNLLNLWTLFFYFR